MKKSYAWAMPGRYDLGIVRLLGPGLCNCLFPWARSMVASCRYGLTPVFPTWPNVSVGPFVRRQQDKRTYHDLFSQGRDYCSGFERLFALVFAKKVFQGETLTIKNGVRPGSMYCFKGSQTFFDGMLQDHGIVRDRLLSMTQPCHMSKLPGESEKWIGVHVRCSDFAPVSTERDLLDGKDNRRQPVQWYVEVVRSLREILGQSVPVMVFSDGTDSELAPLLVIDNCRRTGFGSAIADLHALSRSGILVASGSTFSMWASFLGRMPVVWHTGQLRQRLYPDNPAAETETMGGEGISAEFVHKIHERFSSLHPIGSPV